MKNFIQKFINSISGFSFLVAEFADLGLGMLFYFSLGYDLPTKIGLMIWALVIVGAKTYGWAKSIKTLAIFCAILSAFASVSIFMAVIDTQSQSTTIHTILDDQIASQVQNIEDLKAKRESIPQDQVTNYRRLNDLVTEAQKSLDSFISQKKTESVKEIKLDAWSVFKQIVSIDFTNAPRLVAFIFIVFLATTLEIIIAFTTPKAEPEPIATISTIRPLKSRRGPPTPFTPKAALLWIKMNWQGQYVLTKKDFLATPEAMKIRFTKKWYDDIEAFAIKNSIIDNSGKILVPESKAMEVFNVR